MYNCKFKTSGQRKKTNHNIATNINTKQALQQDTRSDRPGKCSYNTVRLCVSSCSCLWSLSTAIRRISVRAGFEMVLGDLEGI